ncbi:GM24624 [Drosophila sechellia]|uniref:GM24624 n=1 Tax=Drosophila sechellia TaxID=7238 RepID=B4HG77_DROSE|nr:GM24624 [Drosophila sechellia]
MMEGSSQRNVHYSSYTLDRTSPLRSRAQDWPSWVFLAWHIAGWPGIELRTVDWAEVESHIVVQLDEVAELETVGEVVDTRVALELASPQADRAFVAFAGNGAKLVKI